MLELLRRLAQAFAKRNGATGPEDTCGMEASRCSKNTRRVAYYRAKSAECSILAARVTDLVAVCTFRQLAEGATIAMRP
jgi:hypothetical protein